MRLTLLLVPVPLLLAVLSTLLPAAPAAAGERTFAEDVEFLKKHTDIIILGGPDGPSVAVAPAWQGRVMTSTHDAKSGAGYGWINDELIASGKTGPHINVWGGEDRFWMGPEGGQFAIFFAPGAKFTLEDWQTPAVIDTEPFDVLTQEGPQVKFRKRTKLTNYSGTQFDVQIERTVKLLAHYEVAEAIGLPPAPEVKFVGYESFNELINMGGPMSKSSGLLSIWILGMFKPSPGTNVAIPFREGPEAELGPIVNDAYFGKVPEDRLKVRDGVVYFKGDGQMRSKIGIGPKRCKPVLGSFDPERGVLTLVQFSFSPIATDYVNSMWELQENPYAGDVANSYNDGPAAPGAKPLGPFYELESSSPARELPPGQRVTHRHRTMHFTGPAEELDKIAQKVLGVTTRDIAAALP